MNDRGGRSSPIYLLNVRKLAWSTFVQRTGALKFFFTRTLKQPWFAQEVAKPKVRRPLPTSYATALRCEQAQHLKISGIDSQRMGATIRDTKPWRRRTDRNNNG